MLEIKKEGGGGFCQSEEEKIAEAKKEVKIVSLGWGEEEIKNNGLFSKKKEKNSASFVRNPGL